MRSVASEISCSYWLLTGYWQAHSVRCQKERKHLWGVGTNLKYRTFSPLAWFFSVHWEKSCVIWLIGPALRTPEFLVSGAWSFWTGGQFRSSSSERLRPHPAWLSQHLQGLWRGGAWLFSLSLFLKCPAGDPNVQPGLRATWKVPCNFQVLILTLKSLDFKKDFVFLSLSHSPRVLAFLGDGAGFV